VVFYSDNLASSAQRVGFAYEGKTMIFLFENSKNFPTSMVLSESGASYIGTFTPYDSAGQTYSLTLENGGDSATWSKIALSKDIFTQYKNNSGLTASQNLRMRNLYIAMCIYKSLDDYIALNPTLQARGVWTTASKILKIFYPSPVVDIVVGGIGLYVEGKSFIATSNPLSMIDNMSGMKEATTLLINGMNQLFGGGSTPGGTTFVAVTGIYDVTAAASIGTLTLPGSGSVEPYNATNKTIVWSVKSPGTTGAKISGSTLTTTAAGKVTVTATIANGKAVGTPYTQDFTITITSIVTTGVSLNKTSVSFVVGTTETLIPTIRPDNATDKTVSWSSSNTNVATVSDGGIVTGVSVGSATITVKTSNGGKTASCTVTVKPDPVTGVSLNKTSISLVIDTAETLIPTITPDSATNKTVSWSSSNTAVATVSSNGTVDGISAGTATITVKTQDGNKTATCAVTVTPISVSSVSLKSSTNLVVGGTETLDAIIDPPNAANKSVTWSSSNTAVATVSSNGTVTGISVGTATITVKTQDGNKTATCAVTVSTNTITVTGVSLNKASIDLIKGATEKLIATITPSNATDQNVTWSSSDTSVATVSASGMVTAVAAGTATVTAKTVDGGKTANCSVTVTVPIPSVPTSVTADPVSSSSIKVSWKSVTGATGYKVYSSSSASGIYSNVGDVPTTSYTNNGLASDTTYYYKVSAYNSSGESSQSLSVSAVTFTPVPTTPTEFSVQGYGRKYAYPWADKSEPPCIYLGWHEVTGAKGYYVYRSSNSSGPYTKVGTVLSENPINYISYIDEMTSGKTYYYKVSAYNSTGESPQSSYISATTPPALTTPTGVTATEVTSDSITFSWNSVNGASFYYVSIHRVGTSMDGRDETTQMTSFTFRGLYYDETYYFKVYAIGDDDASDWSSVVYAKTKTKP